jgi:hypothetical protein
MRCWSAQRAPERAAAAAAPIAATSAADAGVLGRADVLWEPCFMIQRSSSRAEKLRGTHEQRRLSSFFCSGHEANDRVDSMASWLSGMKGKLLQQSYL